MNRTRSRTRIASNLLDIEQVDTEQYGSLTPKRLPDAICASPAKNFTQVSNDMLRDARISFKAKGLLCSLLSNSSGQWVSYIDTLTKMGTEGETAIRSGLKELEDAGYLVKVFYVDKRTKQRKGSFWAYTDTPGCFEIEDHLNFLEQNGLEVQGGKFKPRYLNMENLNMGNPALKILIDKNKKDITLSDVDFTDFNSDKKTIKEKVATYLPLAEKLAGIVKQSKNINVTSAKMISWADEIRKLIETDGVSQSRVEAALEWYKDHIGGQYIPVIESGASLRSKFTRLEDAMKRSGAIPSNIPTKQPTKPTSPKKIIRAYFKNKDLADFFYRDCYLLAEGLFNYALEGDINKDQLARTLVDMHATITKVQRDNVPTETLGMLPGPIDLISHYLAWVEDSDWITNISLDIFQINHSLFKRFRREEAKNDNLERDPLTGKSYLRG